MSPAIIAIIETVACWAIIAVAFWRLNGPWKTMLFELGPFSVVAFWVLTDSYPRAGLLITSVWNGAFLFALILAWTRRWIRRRSASTGG
jgi:hypothetical protein